MKQIMFTLGLMMAALGTFAQNAPANQAATSATTTTAEPEFKPNGKPEIRIFTNYHTLYQQGSGDNKFAVDRAYLGYEHNFTKELYGRVTLDFGNPNPGATKIELQQTAYLKFAYLRYTKNKLTAHFGLIPNIVMEHQEKQWGARYVYRPMLDVGKFAPSADYGISLEYRFAPIIAADIKALNGEGFKQSNVDSTQTYGLGVTITPLTGLKFRFSGEVASKTDELQQVYAAFVGYQKEKFGIGVEYDKEYNTAYKADQNKDALSIYGNYVINKKMTLIGRYDMLTSNKVNDATVAWNAEADHQWAMLGLDYTITKGIRVCPNVEAMDVDEENSSKCDNIGFFVHFEIRY